MNKQNKQVQIYLSYFKKAVLIIIGFFFILGWTRRLLGFTPYFWRRKVLFDYFAVIFNPSINFLIWFLANTIGIIVLFLLIYLINKSNIQPMKKEFVRDILKFLGVFYILNIIFISLLKIIGFPLVPLSTSRPEVFFNLGAILILIVVICISLFIGYKFLKDKN